MKYLHLGKGTLVRDDEILGIFDLDITSQSHLTRKFLSMAEKAGQVVNAAEDLPKSFVLCRRDGQTRVYLSQMASSTLLRRRGGADNGISETVNSCEQGEFRGGKPLIFASQGENNLLFVFDGALPRQKLPKPSETRPRADQPQGDKRE